MQLSDFFIGKPGPGSLNEALAMNLPVITECGSATLVHERYNATWVEENQVGLVVKNFKQIHKAVNTYLDPNSFLHYRAQVAKLKNRGIFEAIDFLQQLVATSGCAAQVSNSQHKSAA